MRTLLRRLRRDALTFKCRATAAMDRARTGNLMLR